MNGVDSPDLLVGLAADLQDLLAFGLQLFGQAADVLVERVDLAVQLDHLAFPPGHLVLQLRDPAQKLPLLKGRSGPSAASSAKPLWFQVQNLEAGFPHGWKRGVFQSAD